MSKNPTAARSSTTYVNLNEFALKNVKIPVEEKAEVDADLLDKDEDEIYEDGAPSREVLDIADEPDCFIDFPLLTETHPPEGIPRQCEDELLCNFGLYKRLRSSFLISGNSVFQSGIIRGYLGLYHERFLHLLAFPYIIHPFSNFYWVWSLLISLLLMMSLIYEPYMIAFNILTYVNGSNRGISLTVSLILLFDCFLTFRVGYLDKSTVMVYLDPYIIRKRYFPGRFFYNFLTRFPFDYLLLVCTPNDIVGTKTGLTYFRLLAFSLKLLRMNKLYRVMVRLTTSLNLNVWTSQITSHGIIVMFCLHWGACVHWLLPDIVNAYLPQPKKWSWITQLELWDEPVCFQYLNAFLKSLGNLLTLDGGEFIPREKEEIICTSILMIVAVTLFGYFVSTFSTMIMEFTREDNRYKETISCVQEYLKFRKIPPWFRERVLAYYEGKYKGQCFSESQLMETVSHQLKTELLHHNCRRLVENVYLFSNIPMLVMLNLVQKLNYEVYIPGDVVLSPHVNIEQIVFIDSGYFGILNELGECTEILEHGDFFGAMALLCPELPRTTSVVALSITQVYKLSKKDYFECMELFPEVHERVTAVAHTRIRREVRKFEKQFDKAQKTKHWREIIMQGKKTVEQYYEELDAGRIPSHHIAPSALQTLHYQNYKRTLEKMEKLNMDAKMALGGATQRYASPPGPPTEVYLNSSPDSTSSTDIGTMETGNSEESSATRPSRARQT